MATANLLQTSVSGGTQNALSLQGDGVFFPKASTTSRLALTLTTTDKGFIVYDTTDNNIYFWNGAAWESVPSSGDAGANGSVQYNDNGIVSGATNFVWDKVNGQVGIGTASPVQTLTISGEASLRVGDVFYWNGYYNAGFKARAAGYAAYISESGTGDLVFANTSTSAAGAGSAVTFRDRYRIDKDGVQTWEYVGGVAGTAMTLNSTGLGIGGPAVSRLTLGTDTNPDGSNKFLFYRGGSSTQYSVIENTGGTAYRSYGTGGHFFYINNGTTEAVRVDTSGNVGIGVSTFGTSAAKVLGLANATAPSTSPAGMGQLYVEAGALKFRGSGGTVTTIAAA